MIIKQLFLELTWFFSSRSARGNTCVSISLVFFLDLNLWNPLPPFRIHERKKKL